VNLPVVFTLNNPLLAPILIMITCFLLGGALACGVFWLARKRYYDNRVQEYAKTELARLETQHAGDMDRITDMEERNVALKVRIAQIALFLGKAITQAQIDE